MSNIIDPWGSTLPESYEKIIKEFGLELFNEKLFPKPNKLMRRGVDFCGRDLKVISDCIKKKKKFYVLTGIMPSGDKIHLGNKMVIENLRYFQERGAKAYVLIADLEANATRNVSLEEGRKRALNFHIPAYIALGLDPKKTVFYFQSENKVVSNLAYEFSKKATLNEFKAIYGEITPARILSALTQVGDILFPQTIEKMPGIIPIGIDQDPHMRLTRDIIKRTFSKYKFNKVASIYNKYTPSLDGWLKMSKSKPESMIELPEEVSIVCKKIKRAVTGGRKTLEEHRKLGAEVEKCMVFELLKQHLVEDDKELDKIYKEYKTGKMTSSEIKDLACKKMTNFMNDFNKKLIKARKLIPKLNFIRN